MPPQNTNSQQATPEQGSQELLTDLQGLASEALSMWNGRGSLYARSIDLPPESLKLPEELRYGLSIFDRVRYLLILANREAQATDGAFLEHAFTLDEWLGVTKGNILPESKIVVGYPLGGVDPEVENNQGMVIVDRVRGLEILVSRHVDDDIVVEDSIRVVVHDGLRDLIFDMSQRTADVGETESVLEITAILDGAETETYREEHGQRII